MRIKQLILLCFLCLFVNTAYAACMGPKHWIGTSGSTELCQEEHKLKKAKEAAELQQEFKERRKEIEEIKAPKNSATSTGNKIEQHFGSMLGGGASGSGSDMSLETPLPTAKYEIEIGYSLYYFPSMAGFSRQMPVQNSPNNFSLIYNVSESLAFMGMYQIFELKGSQFDPVTEERDVEETIEVVDPDTGDITLATRTVTKTFTVYQPGAKKAKHTRYLYYAQWSGLIGDEFAIYGRMGSGIAKVELETTTVDADGVEESSTAEYEAKQPWAIEVGLKKKFKGVKIGFYTRILQGDNEEDDIFKYYDLSTTEYGVNIAWDITPWGIL